MLKELKELFKYPEAAIGIIGCFLFVFFFIIMFTIKDDFPLIEASIGVILLYTLISSFIDSSNER